ncbi:aldehyde dehydrogenase [Streptomyces sp. NWU49]|uniref:aldehyde dehydrogenase n=1 Tax=Streptomyces sp. NWU49 TaxID=2201153 RepID=UPI000D682474|nr:aldehyde dehydrogenase [Streptomyces sp. NWU49]PWJ02209.1 aldehyde dehydrogenase [Streptomyces sp. NWU49]
MELDRRQLFIGGRWTEPADGSGQDVIEAATGKVLGRTAMASAADVDAAVAAARTALAGPWGSMPAQERADLLDRFAAALKARGREIAPLVSRENGMPLSLSIPVNGFSASMTVAYYARLLRELPETDVRPSLIGETVVRREPVGVVGAITPWNYPQSLAAMKIGPALAAGCTVVLKPAPETALDAFYFADAAQEAGLPPGVLNVLPGGREAGEQLVSHPGVDKIAFTGSTAAGRAIGEQCGRLLRPVTLELGGKSAAILAEDADLAAFTAALLDVSLTNNGQTCHASTRILAPAARYEEIVDAVTDTVRALRVGDPLDRSTEVGPLVSAAQRDRVRGYVDLGVREGARLTTGGSAPVDGLTDGWFVRPTVLADVDNDWRVAREEIFGPVLCVIRYEDEDHAVALANDSDYGLGGTVWTADLDHGMDLAARIRTGTIGVNQYGVDLQAPFGGVKASGLGREMGPEGLAPYHSLKSVYRPAQAATA